MRYSEDKRMTCDEAQRLVDLYMIGDPGLTAEDRRLFEVHLQNCTKCAQEYEESRWVGLGLLAISFVGITGTLLYARKSKVPHHQGD